MWCSQQLGCSWFSPSQAEQSVHKVVALGGAVCRNDATVSVACDQSGVFAVRTNFAAHRSIPQPAACDGTTNNIETDILNFLDLIN